MLRNISVLLEVTAFLYCLAKCFGHKLRFNIYVVILEMIAMFLATAISDYGFPTYFMSIYYISLFLYALAYYGEGVKRALINIFLTFAIIFIIQLIAFFPLYYLLFNGYEQRPINELFINILCAITIVLISYKISFKKISDFFWKRNKLVTAIPVLILLIIGINIYKMKYILSGIPGDAYIQLVFFGFILAFVIYEWQKSRIDAEKKKTQLDMNALYYDAYDQLIMLIRERQHDMKNHINTIMSMIYTIEDYDELVAKQMEYCNQVMERNDKTRLVLAVGNPLISGFLYSNIQETEKNKIELEYHIDINKTTIVIPEYELIEMASVLVDNAIEALCSENEKSEEVQIKKIYVSMKETEEKLELIVANTSDYLEEDITKYFFEAGYSSKGNGRGIGLSKLKRMVHEKMGDIIVSNENYDDSNYLQFNIIIPAKSKGRKAVKNDK